MFVYIKSIVLILFIFVQYLPAQSGNISDNCTLKGFVYGPDSEILPSANIILLNTDIGTSTGIDGSYTLKNIPPGKYTIRVSYIGYKSNNSETELFPGQIKTLDFTLDPNTFYIGGIEVTAEKPLLPNEIETKTFISGGELEHLQASSLNDILEFIPEAQRNEYQDLSKTTQLALRGFEEDKNSAMGTAIYIDGVPVSNNANLQFERPLSSVSGMNNIGAGIDLRTIPADNIESIEVISGTPSVKYGDLTEGIINIKTKSGKQPFRIKLKSNPGLYEGNLSGSFRIKDDNFADFNFNLANSQRNIRIDGDDYTRLTFQTKVRTFNNSKLKSSLKLSGQFIYDEYAANENSIKSNSYNRGHSISFAAFNSYKGKLNIQADGYFDLKKENSLKSRFVSGLYVTPYNDTIAGYNAKVQSKGFEVNAGSIINFSKSFNGKYNHTILFGSELKYFNNYGEGVIFDTVFNYYGWNSGVKPYRFDDIKGSLIASIYFEDEIKGNMVYPFSLSIGFRYELFNPKALKFQNLFNGRDLIESKNGSYFDPRVGLLIKLNKNNQLRFSYGKTSKTPPLSYLYARDEFYKWRDPFSGETLFFTKNLHTPEIKGVRENQLELSYDYKLLNAFGISISAYLRERRLENTGLGLSSSKKQPVPVFYEVIQNNNNYIYYIGEYEISRNLGWTNLKGLDLKLNSKKIENLNLTFYFSASYIYNISGRNGFEYKYNPEVTKGQIHNYQIPGISIDTLYGMTYTPTGLWKDQLNLKYRFVYTSEKLGLWFTLYAGHLAYERSRYIDPEPKDRELLSETDKIIYDKRRSTIINSNKWRFNFSLSKSVFYKTEISFYVNNFIDNIASSDVVAASNLFYGIEFSTIL